MDYLDKIDAILAHLEQRFPSGNDPFQGITRLCEEAGELAMEVNHREGSGIKKEKHGEHRPEAMAKEVQDVMPCALWIARHYGIIDRVKASIDESYRTIQEEV